ncbi:hypothetical protein FHS43_006920 [Streptosporangium becharense]|uniref:Uncharacterized protein n=1 Tax=Streptosporangium becharense TaxID=1816182 RepID=A0A7W9IAB2_9ACTN|nr:hypothetical protein [Streptosporangium becharense]MBB2915597.1 hypothetical protein [Streptosporangium becharense]MBB5817038.1 hypothetical protein [Streptosporangium becharense]
MSGPSGQGTDQPAEAHDPWLGRVLREGATPRLLTALAERLSPTDLQTLLLEVYRRRAAAVTPGRLLRAYEDNRFTAPSPLDAGELTRLNALVHDRLARHAFTALALSPLCPLGTNSAVATVDQNKVVTTVRNTEAVADATNVLALECAVRRRQLLRADPRSRARVRLAATHRVVRAQVFAGPGMTAHFALLGLCTAGRAESSFIFETAALTEQIGVHLDILDSARTLGYRVRSVRVSVTDLTAGRHRRTLRESVLDPLTQAYPATAFVFDDERGAGRGYYSGACFEIRATTPAGDDLNLGDGGFTTWSADLLSDARERLLISGLGLERLCERFRGHPR